MELEAVTYEDLEDVGLPPMEDILISDEDSDDEYLPGIRAKPKRSARIKELPKNRGKKEATSTVIVKKPGRGRKKKKSESEDEFSG